jgi:hypothetical protein
LLPLFFSRAQKQNTVSLQESVLFLDGGKKKKKRLSNQFSLFLIFGKFLKENQYMIAKVCTTRNYIIGRELLFEWSVPFFGVDPLGEKKQI